MPRRLVILFAAVIVMSMTVVQTRHESRQLFAQLQAQQAEP